MEVGSYFQFILALLFVLALILLFAYGAKRFGLMARVTVNSTKTRHKRLDIVEILTVDARRKLILIRRDDVEHLILSGAENDVVIEQNIKSAPKINRIENS
ncbi:MAG: flagellar biosynthetic protein FliO [Emcibacter sp.]|nr:flagellar biosynthetic protein FliO [Emcibacter sp.]